MQQLVIRLSLVPKSGVPGNLKGNETLIGTPPTDPKAYFKSIALTRRLPEIYKELNELKHEVEKVKRDI